MPLTPKVRHMVTAALEVKLSELFRGYTRVLAKIAADPKRYGPHLRSGTHGRAILEQIYLIYRRQVDVIDDALARALRFQLDAPLAVDELVGVFQEFFEPERSRVLEHSRTRLSEIRGGSFINDTVMEANRLIATFPGRAEHLIADHNERDRAKDGAPSSPDGEYAQAYVARSEPSDPEPRRMTIPEKVDGVPLVFISYSHDSTNHKAWVRCLAEHLVRNGVEVILDQWHLKHGHDLAIFMEQGIVSADYVLMICTERYVTKANERAGGVGYESLFLTSQLLEKVDSEKLIPVIRQFCEPRQRPNFVTSRAFADLSNDANYETEVEELLRTLHNAPRYQPPPRGPNPFAGLESGGSVSESPRALRARPSAAELPEWPIDIFELGRQAIDGGDMFAWNQLLEKALTTSRQTLLNWRATRGTQYAKETSAAQSWTFEIVNSHSSVVALAVSAGMTADYGLLQGSVLINRLASLDGWERSSHMPLDRAPESIAWAIHLLVGAASIYANRLDVALSLARSKSHIDNKTRMLVECKALTGWPPTLERSIEAWEFITDLKSNWPWLETVFGDKHSYRTMLTTYQLSLSIVEFSERLRRGDSFDNHDPWSSGLWVPLQFIGENDKSQERARRIVMSQPDAVQSLFAHAPLREAANSQWPKWLSYCAQASKSEFRYGEGSDRLARYADLIPSILAS